MLLHKCNIIVDIAIILSYKLSPYDIPGLKYKILSQHKTLEKGVIKTPI